MDPKQQAQPNPEMVPPTPVISPTPQPHSKVLAIIALLCLGIAGFFAYQYFQLKQQISQQAQTNLSISPSPNLNQQQTAFPTTAVQQITDSTKDWQIYTSSTYNLSFKYPNSFRVNESNKNDTGFGKSISVDYNQTGGQPQRWISISIVDKTTIQPLLNLSMGQVYKYTPVKDFPVSNTRLSNQQIGGIEAMVFDADRGWEMPTGPLRTFIVLKDNVYYKIFTTYSNTSVGPNNNFVQIVDQILSTFSFSNQAQTIDLTTLNHP
jgi:hypothetical protein